MAPTDAKNGTIESHATRRSRGVTSPTWVWVYQAYCSLKRDMEGYSDAVRPVSPM